MAGHSLRLSPSSLRQCLPVDPYLAQQIKSNRQDINDLLDGGDKTSRRLLVMVGPCSIHDTEAALEYADRLAKAAQKYRDQLLIVMRVYIEKPRTTVGWKGLVHSPDLKETGPSDLGKGLRVSREIMIKVAETGLPVVTEILSPLILPFLEDVLSCGVIGARTTESQSHRELVSDTEVPVGFKNGTDGGLAVALDAMKASSQGHSLLGIDEDGCAVERHSAGNKNTFIVLRGGKSGPNYGPEHIQSAKEAMAKAKQQVKIVVDCSHGNSSKDYRRQPIVAESIARQVAGGAPISGVMLESNINAGRQDIGQNGLAGLKYGVSVTDGCIDWAETEKVLGMLASAVKLSQGETAVTATAAATPAPAPTAQFSVAALSTRRSSFHMHLERLRPTLPVV